MLAGSQDGFLLIEVLVSAVLLALIAAATVTGLQAVDDSAANQRFHNEAVLLAAQSQEQLRADPVSTLEKLASAPHAYSLTVDNTKYTLTQEAQEFTLKEEVSNCSVVSAGAYTAPDFRVSSKVSWSFLKAGKPVEESSVVTPPTSSSLEVDVGNAPSPTAGVPGLAVVATYAAYETGTPIRLEGNTNNNGCVLFTGIRATAATVELPEAQNYVTPSGALKVPTSEVSIAPNLATRDQVTYNEGGAIAAQFAYEGKTEAHGKKVLGDTFVVSNNEMNLSPELEVGTAGTFTYESGGEERYTAKTGAYATSGLTAKGGHYERGDLFPLPSAWKVFAGDCAANNPTVVTKGEVTAGEGTVTAGNTTAVVAPMSYVSLEALQGTEKAPTTEKYGKEMSVLITNLSCSAASPAPPTPNNAASVSYTHPQNIVSGALEYPFQPFGKFEICAQAEKSSSKPSEDRVDRYIYENTKAAGASPKLYPQETGLPEKKAAREAEEKANVEKWKEEVKNKTLEEAKRIEKENKQTANKPTLETEEKNKEKTKEKEESEGKAQKVESGSSAEC